MMEKSEREEENNLWRKLSYKHFQNYKKKYLNIYLNGRK